MNRNFIELAERISLAYQQGGKIELANFLKLELALNENEAEKIAENFQFQKVDWEELKNLSSDDWLKLQSNKNTSHFRNLGLELKSFDKKDSSGVWPKNKLAWELIRKTNPEAEFNFKIPEDSVHEMGKNRIFFEQAGFKGAFSKLITIALDLPGSNGLPPSISHKAKILLDRLGDVGRDLAITLLKQEMIFPPELILKNLINSIYRGLQGETVIITGAFCPDYEYRATGRKDIPYEYTFRGVGSDIGLVAKQFVRMTPALVDFFKKHKIPFKIVYGIGDFEANDDSILKRVGLSRDEFIYRCQNSNQKFVNLMRDMDIDVEVRLCQEEWANGRWNESVGFFREQFNAGNFLEIRKNTGKNPEKELDFIAEASCNFYSTWYNKKLSNEELKKIIISQATEYASFGKIIKEDFGSSPVIQLAGDRPKIQIFGSAVSSHPVLCAKRIY